MVSTPPSLLREWVNAKHTGGVPNQSCPPAPPPHCWTVDLFWGKSMCALASLETGLRCAEQSSGSLAEALLSTGGLSFSLRGPHSQALPNAALPEPLLSHPLSSGHTGVCIERP